MHENINAAEWDDAVRRADAGRYDQVSIALHWLTAVLVTNQVVTAWLAGWGYGAAALLVIHRSAGAVTW